MKVVGVSSWTRWVRAGRKERQAETIPRAYMEAVEGSGALPVLLPNSDDAALAERYLELVDGLLMSGGDDPHPRLFGEEPHGNIEIVDERRDRFELELTRGAHDRGMPVFGICRGAQIMNIALGGDIFQDIASQTDSSLQHIQRTTSDGPWHEVEVRAGSRLADIVSAGPLRVNSFHHQACRQPGEGLEICATSSDGLVEAVEDPGLPFFLGVQWHPELTWNEPDSASQALFRAFVSAVEKRSVGE